MGDYFFVHSESDGRRLKELVPSALITYAFHPLYDFFDTGMLSKPEARAKLNLQEDTILFFGFIRPYKGVENLLRAMPRILKQRRVTLLVVGEFWDGREAFTRLIAELKIEDAVKVVDRYVPNEEVGLFFSAADLIVLPYTSGTGSGIVQIANGLEKPVVATRVGSLPEVVEDGSTGYLVNPGDPEALAQAVIRFYAEEKEAEFIDGIRRRKDRFSWQNLVTLIDTMTTRATPPGFTCPRAASPQDAETVR
jgi:glycosyltransferase involved in cell wall biosynthesis